MAVTHANHHTKQTVHLHIQKLIYFVYELIYYVYRTLNFAFSLVSALLAEKLDL